MKTRHVATVNDYDITTAIRAALRETKSYENYLRVVNCGRGVIILPDTNRKQDCTEGEAIKALGLVKHYDGLHLEKGLSEKKDERKPVMLRYADNTPEWLSLTPDQVRLLNWLYDCDYLYDEVRFQEMGSAEFKEI